MKLKYTIKVKVIIGRVFAPEFFRDNDPLRIEAIWCLICRISNFSGRVVAEKRSINARDITWWDILWKYS